MTIHLVSHFHWDREWYRPWQAFRARLVDAVELVLELAEADPGYRFVLDGQTVVLEDVVELRPAFAGRLARQVGGGSLAIGPWYVQPDSLLPSGEAHVRNLLLGRRTGGPYGAVSTVAYVPDSFGHPAQFPQLFAGFGLEGFVYWRGNGGEIDDLGPRWRWRAPDGSEVRALLLTEGYFAAARLDAADDEPDGVAARLEPLVARMRSAGEEPVVLMNGFDHTRPDRRTRVVAAALADRLGEPVRRSLLEEVLADAPAADATPSYEGPLVGARLTNLLPGVWSARMPLKRRNRRVESLLEQWAEPWCAIGVALGLIDERASLASAWRSLLQNQAHDSLCGCSIDAVHDRMAARYDDAERLTTETTRRTLERLAGRPLIREVPWSDEQSVVVFNPSPEPCTAAVRIPLDADPALAMTIGEPAVHPLALARLAGRGFTVDGRPVDLVPAAEPGPQWLPDQEPVDLEFVARDVPAFGCRTYRLTPATHGSHPATDVVDDGTEIGTEGLTVRVGHQGTLDVAIGEERWSGLFGLDDVGDRGDSYDHDPVGTIAAPVVAGVVVERRRAASGIQELSVTRQVEFPAGLDDGRDARLTDLVTMAVTVDCRVVPGLARIDARVTVDNRARDHRLRLLFPTGAPVGRFEAATTFDAEVRSTSPVDGTDWVHPPPRTFCQQGWIAAGALAVAAPGLPEAEVLPDGVVALTLVRAVGWLARFDLATRPLPAGPVLEAPGAQTLEPVEAAISLWAHTSTGGTARSARRAESGLWGVIGGEQPILEPGRPTVELDGDEVVLSALKPAEDGDGIVTRVLNPTARRASATLRFGFPVAEVSAVRLDEQPDDRRGVVPGDAGEVRVDVPAHALRSLRIRAG